MLRRENSYGSPCSVEWSFLVVWTDDRSAVATSTSCCNEKGKFDELIEEKGVKVLIDPKALMHVIGTKMDFVDDKLRSEFIFINPNSKGQCGCGESFMTTAGKGPGK
ncbi:Iron-sulfur assembly protein IscA-like 1, mitochondrial [Capsicum baccatum]|uniref:Iron-sulfur assembly protein IscA-like 1, mitochondrial n=1 Tax=Capsicum baccatum TaxID=33114 RepID=A0A2G2VWX6_CAPBA|nr:Iron-sulfur assembly protein IscA-like 1, mitochondrial [Capsicum baccatum]